MDVTSCESEKELEVYSADAAVVPLFTLLKDFSSLKREKQGNLGVIHVIHIFPSITFND
jgi:hypothetical protein